MFIAFGSVTTFAPEERNVQASGHVAPDGANHYLVAQAINMLLLRKAVEPSMLLPLKRFSLRMASAGRRTKATL